MREQPPKQPAWEDISLTEIEAFIAGDRVADALTLTGLRLDGIKNIPAELRLALAAAGSLPSARWKDELRAFEAEIIQLQQIINNYRE